MRRARRGCSVGREAGVPRPRPCPALSCQLPAGQGNAIASQACVSARGRYLANMLYERRLARVFGGRASSPGGMGPDLSLTKSGEFPT